MNDIIIIPLSKLTAFPGNVRKTRDKAFIDELAASIKAHGLQQNLVVRKDGKKYAVVAGGQRLKALQQLAANGDIGDSYPVPCKVNEDGIDDSEVSLAENVMRLDMHPADQFEAFRALADKGMPAADIGARFGKPEAHVLRLLRLARVAPKIIKAYRAGEITLEHVMAFAITEDHKAQLDVFDRMGRWTTARQVRDALTDADIPATDRRVKFVTLKAYEKRGGALKRDLFSEGEDGVFVTDAALLDTLAAEGLEKQAAAVRAEGWKWVETALDFGYEQRQRFHRIHAEPVPLTPAEQKKLDKLHARYEKLDAAWQESEDGEEPPELAELQQQIDAIEERDGVWTKDQLAMSGAVVYIGHNGKAEIERGRVRPEDMPKKSAKPKKANGAASPDVEQDDSPALSAALIESLTAHKSAALAVKLAETPNVALAAVVYALARDTFGHRGDTALKLSGSSQSLHRVEGSPAFQQMQAAREGWGQRIPGKPEDIWHWCLEQPVDVLLDLLAFCAASSVNAVRLKADRADNDRLQHAGRLAQAVGLDMKAWFTPDAGNYFSRVSKAQNLAAIAEAKGQPPAPAWEKLKKAELAKVAERETAGTGWLPEMLRA